MIDTMPSLPTTVQNVVVGDPSPSIPSSVVVGNQA